MAHPRPGDTCPKCHRGTVRLGRGKQPHLVCSRCNGIWSIRKGPKPTKQVRPRKGASIRRRNDSSGSTVAFLLVAGFVLVFVVYIASQH